MQNTETYYKALINDIPPFVILHALTVMHFRECEFTPLNIGTKVVTRPWTCGSTLAKSAWDHSPWPRTYRGISSDENTHVPGMYIKRSLHVPALLRYIVRPAK